MTLRWSWRRRRNGRPPCAPRSRCPTSESGAALKLVLACLALAALAHFLPAAPTYDPWAWIIWGREIIHLDLDTRTGPSWKPLPVLFTMPFALAGDRWAPELWLVIAQAGGLLAFAYTFRLARRLAGPIAGVIAVIGLLLVDEFVRNFARGNSEGLLVAFCLWAVERHLDGHRRHAFALGVLAGLLRPELWPFLLAYGLWLMWVDRGAIWLVLGGGALTLLLWFVPEYLGSGDFFRAASRAREPNPDSAAFADHPFVETWVRAAETLMLPMLIGAAIALVRAWRDRDTLRLALGGIAAALMFAVAAMTQAGFAGNLRYVALPAALICVLAGAGWVELVRDSAARWGRAAGAGIAVAAVALCMPLVMPFVDMLTWDLDVVQSESGAYDRLGPMVEKAGGADAMLACGPVYAPPFEVQAVAYAMGLHSKDIQLFAAPPGTTIAGKTSALAHDPRFAKLTENTRWVVSRNCRGGTP
jgi:hypothetical protein